MKQTLLIVAATLPFAVLGIFISHIFPAAFLWYAIFWLLSVEVAIRLSYDRSGRVDYWINEIIWIPYHCFLIYLIGRLLNVGQPQLLWASILFPLFTFAAVVRILRLSK